MHGEDKGRLAESVKEALVSVGRLRRKRSKGYEGKYTYMRYSSDKTLRRLSSPGITDMWLR